MTTLNARLHGPAQARLARDLRHQFRLLGMSLVPLFAAAAFPICAQAQEEVIDFESIAPNLPGWRAIGNVDGEQKSWNLSQPGAFTGTVDSAGPHSGGNSLKVEFSQEVRSAGIMLMNIPVSGPAIELRFFVKSEGVGTDGLVSLYEYTSSGERTQLHWGITKSPESSEWSEVTCKIKLQPETESIRLSLSYPSVPAEAKVWIDDLTVKTVN